MVSKKPPRGTPGLLQCNKFTSERVNEAPEGEPKPYFHKPLPAKWDWTD